MRRRLVIIGASVGLLFGSLPAIGAEPPTNSRPAVSAGDADGDGVSDSLAETLQSRPEKVDVIVSLSRPGRAADLFAAAGVFQVKAEFSLIDGFSAQMTAAQVQALAQHPNVFRVQEDALVTAFNSEANEEFGTAQARSDYGLSGAGVNICILDTGIDATHEQLDDGKVIAHYDPITNSPTPIDDQGHGTHVAATAAGDGVGSSPSASLNGGVAPAANLMSAKVLDSSGSGEESGIILGMEWCLAEGADVLSMSIGTATASDGNSAMDQAADNAVGQGAVVVVAAGNSGDGPGTVGSPAASNLALTVGAAGKMSDGLRLAPFSSRGPLSTGVIKPDIVAPGMAIVSADANSGSQYVSASGTSMATPFMAGTVALALQANSSLNSADIKALLASTAIDLGPSGSDGDWGSGLVDGYGFLSAASGSTGAMALPRLQALSGSVDAGGSWTGTFDVTDTELGDIATATVLIANTACTLDLLGLCFGWGPDLDVRLINPVGQIVAVSECPLSGECAGAGHQETFVFTPTIAGTWSLEVYPFSTDPGSPFTIDVFTGAPGTGTPPPPNNNPPEAMADSYVGQEDQSLVVTAPGVLVNDVDPDTADVLAVSAWASGSGGVVSGSSDGSFSFAPTPDFDGVAAFSYTVTDGNGSSDTAVVQVSLVAQPDAPVANDDEASTQQDQAVTVDVATNDSDADGDLNRSTVAVIADPAFGSAVSHGDGTITYVPDSGFVGSDSFGYEICDDTDRCASAAVSVVVTETPVISSVVRVVDIDGSSELFNRGRWRASAAVFLADGNGNAVTGATVSVDIDGRIKTCVTDAVGSCSVKSRRLASSVLFSIFTVTDVVVDGYDYDETLTLIVVVNPGL